MPLGDYLVGLLLFSVTVIAAGTGAVLATGVWTPLLRSSERVLAAGLLAIAALVAIHLVAAALGILGRGSVPVIALLLLGAVFVAARRSAPANAPDVPPRADREPGLSRAIALLGAGAVALYLLATLAKLATVPALGVDPLNFHLPSIARWLQTGSIWQIDQFLPGQAQGNYPANGNLFQLAAILPWLGDFLIRFVNLPLIAIAGLALVVAGRELGASLSTAALTAATALAIPASTLYVVNTVTPDPFMVATFAAGLAFLVRHARTAAVSDLVLAGIGLGLAFGSRWYGVSCVVALLVAWLVCRLAGERDWRSVIADFGRLAGVVALGGGFWLIRNWIESGNPLFPVEVDLLGISLFDAPPDPARDAVGFSISHYLTEWDAWSDYLLPAFAATLGLGAAVLGAGAIVAGAAALRLREPTVIWLAAAALACILAYVVTPYTALGFEGAPVAAGSNTRYVLPAALLAAPAVAWGVTRLRRGRLLAELILLAGVADGLRRGIDLRARDLALALALVGVAAGAGFVLVRVRTAGASARPRALLVGAVAVLVFVVVGHLGQQRFFEDRYRGGGPALDRALTLATPGSRVGIAGAWDVGALSPVYPLFGPRLENEVSAVGRFVDGAFRAPRTSAEFAAMVEDRRYELLLVGRAPMPFTPATDEIAWASEVGFGSIAADSRFVLFAPNARDGDGP